MPSQESSVPCQMHNTDPTYHGFMNASETAGFLDYILRMKQLAVLLCDDAGICNLSIPQQSALVAIRDGKRNSYNSVLRCLEHLRVRHRIQYNPPIQAEKITEKMETQLMYLRSVQQLVAQAIEINIPRVHDDVVKKTLQETLVECRQNQHTLLILLEDLGLYSRERSKSSETRA